MDKSGIEVWLEGALDHCALCACPAAAPLPPPKKRKGNTTPRRGHHEEPSKPHPDIVAHAQALDSSDAPIRRAVRGRAREVEPTALLPEPHGSGTRSRGARAARAASPTKRKTRPPRDRVHDVHADDSSYNAEGSVNRNIEHDADANANTDTPSKLLAASLTSPTDVVPDPASSHTTFSATSRTTATLCPSLVPIAERSGEALQSKLVDYALHLVPARHTPLADAIDHFVAAQAPGMRTVAPTMYDPVRRRPQAVAIETKAVNSASDPLVQLTVWAQATFTRFRQLIESSHGGKQTMPVLTLPLIEVRGHEWHLWFSQDAAQTFELYGPLMIGSTETVLNTFKLVRSLRVLGEWVDTDFKSWIESAFALP
ncbi:hypothetical protein EKO27_g9250 [Xylaria grammica]|uniref:PD-(D/E)XK nuclease-like domain-containing protein n=1 Tax=Xylaria grammica TaxID=363999 RepID=A0A439CUM6_9PEZI|nr:hypothetical protein EKO27_g9250 [Xylaria grammica]